MASSVVALRCRYCSAPLDVSAGSGETVVCKSCGTAQKMLDARHYLEELKLTVSDWLRKAVPLGLDLSSGANVDPVARYGVFVNNVKPRLDTEFVQYRFNMSTLLSQPLVTLPYSINDQLTQSNEAKDAFLFQAKIQSVYPLAVNPEAKKIVDDANAVAVCYAYLLNNVGLLKEAKPERLALMEQNFASAATAMDSTSVLYPGLVERLQADSKTAASGNAFVDGNLSSAAELAQRAIPLYDKSLELASTSMNSAIMVHGIQQEKRVAESIAALAGDSRGNPTDDAVLLGKFQAISQFVQRYPHLVGDPQRLSGIVQRYLAVRGARLGKAPVRYLPGPGQVYYPFWAIDLRYSFTTGALWAKKGKDVSEYLLVAANAFAGGEWNSGRAVTDVFSARSHGGLFDSLTGKETSISGGGVGTLLQRSTNGFLPAPTIPAFANETDATEMATAYMNGSMLSDPKVRQKLRLSAPRVVEVVYVPANVRGGVFDFPGLGPLAPTSTGDATALAALGV